MHHFAPHDWLVVDDAFNPDLNRFHETIFYLGNGYMGVRGTPEEGFPAEKSSRYTFLAPIYDVVPAGGWRVPVRECSVMVKVPDFFPIGLTLGGVKFDPLAGKVSDYSRTLNMKEGTVVRKLTWEDRRGRRTEFEITRFVSMADRHVAAFRFSFRPLNYTATAVVEPSIDGYDTGRQRETSRGGIGKDGAFLCVETLKTGYKTAMAMRARLLADGSPVETPRWGVSETCHRHVSTIAGKLVKADKLVSRRFQFTAKKGTLYTIEKYAGVCTSRDTDAPSDRDPRPRAIAKATEALKTGFDLLLDRHRAAWARIWADNDVAVEGDSAAQQGIRLCIFNMHQNYAGDDPRVNMAAKGLSGPGYGGLYWWDTEMYMLPFFIYTDPAKARKLAMYRWCTIDGARRKAAWMGYKGAMYPWVTIDGEERSGDWEYGMFEQHVTSAMAYAVHHYIGATQDFDYLWNYGAEVVIETARFWASRTTYNARRRAYVINAVTGPDEYAVNVNNNCYTNAMAKFNIDYALKVVPLMRNSQPARWRELAKKIGFRKTELAYWRDISRRMLIPFDEELGIHPQDDAFLDRDPVDVSRIPESERPINSKWPWERVLRTQAIKQADVVLLMFLLSDRFTADEKRRNYEFYEPKTMHDSSLSPCMHAIMAAELGLDADAFKYYLRSARLDLDDVNRNASEGFHIANMAGSWMSIVNGFGGMRLRRGGLATVFGRTSHSSESSARHSEGRAGRQSCKLHFNPRLPRQWKRLAFKIKFRGRTIAIEMRRRQTIFRLEGNQLGVVVAGQNVLLRPGREVVV